MPAAFRRVILKVSGESLSGPAGEPVSAESADRLAAEIRAAVDKGAEIGVVIGGGNLIRGTAAAAAGADRVSADYAGMVATLINGGSARGLASYGSGFEFGLRHLAVNRR